MKKKFTQQVLCYFFLICCTAGIAAEAWPELPFRGCTEPIELELANAPGGAICPQGAEVSLGVGPGAPAGTYNGMLTVFAGGAQAEVDLGCLADDFGPDVDNLQIFLQSSVVNEGLSDLPCNKTLDVTLSVVDPTGNHPPGQLLLRVHFHDIRPPLPDQGALNAVQGSCGSSLTLTPPTGYDDCAGPVIATTQDPVTYTQEGTYTVHWTFSDGCGNAGEYTQQVIIGDQTAPTIDCSGINPVRNTRPGQCFYISHDGEFEPTFSDNCGATLYTNYSQSDNVDGSFFSSGTTALTWTVTDAGGLSASCTVHIQVIDAQAPTALCRNLTVDLSAFGTATIAAADIDNGSYDNCGISSRNISQAGFDCSDIGVQTVTLTVIDYNNNPATCTADVTVNGGPDCQVADCTDGINAQGLPCGWNTSDNGIACDDGNKGSYNAATGTFTLIANGCYPATASADESAFISYDLCGNGSITAHIAGLTLPGYAGIVMRETGAPGAKKVALAYQGGNTLARYVRYTTNGASYPSFVPTAGSRWLRIVRSGNLFKGYHSTNGVNWIYSFAVTVPMQSCIQIGLVAWGPNGSSQVTASFDHVAVDPPYNLRPLAGTGLNPQVATQEAAAIWPNPAAGQTTLSLDDAWGENITVSVMDELGRRVKTIRPSGFEGPQLNLDLNGEAPGLYFVRIENAEGRRKALRLVLTRP